ncbi:MAG: hypothetical protein AAFV86_01935, partial [Pseudomonadota bacterium]
MTAVAGEGGRAALLLAGLLALAGCQVAGEQPPVAAAEGAVAGAPSPETLPPGAGPDAASASGSA